MSGLSRILRNHFVAGLIVLVPIVLTIKALGWLFVSVDALAEPLARLLLGRPAPGLGFVLTVATVFFTGVVFSAGPLRRLVDGLDELVDAVPIVGVVYGTTKKVLSGFGGTQSEEGFKRFVLARLRGRTTPAFLMGSFTLRAKDGTETRMSTVYVPTNHLYVGDVVVLPPEDVIDTDMSVEDGMSLILSAGASMPDRIAER